MSENSLSINQLAGKVKLKVVPAWTKYQHSQFTTRDGNRLAGYGGGIGMT